MSYSYFIARSIQRYIQQRQRDKARIARAAQRVAEAKARYDHEVTPRQQRAFAVLDQHAAQTKEHARVYRFARDAMLDTLDVGRSALIPCSGCSSPWPGPSRSSRRSANITTPN